MKFKTLKIFVITLLIGSFSFLVFASNNDSNDDLRRELLMKVISFAINNGHYAPGEIDDEFSQKAWELYIDRIDFSKRFLLEEDIKMLSKYKNQLDNAMLENDFTFLDLSDEIVDKRISQSEDYYKDALAEPFDFSKEEWYELDPDKTVFASSEKELKERWRKSLKYETLARIHASMEEQEKAAEKSDTVTIKSFAQLEEEARKKILKRYDDWYHRMSKLDEYDRLNTYVNSLVSVFDPHTQYFPPRDKENFDIRFSGQLEGIGAQLTQKNIYIEVTRIIPGSPSWKQGELEVGDYILKVKQEGEEPVDVVDMRLDEAVQLIRGKKGSKVTLTIKKLEGTIKDITLVRDVVILEETYAKSAVIKDEETGENYGYIKLPSFYVDFSKINGKNCYDDVKAEIEKLKKEEVAGIIFDIRDNGGGSLEDVVKIAGLFIEEGPVVQSRGKRNLSKIYRDEDRDIQFDGPLVVMVNAVSASASEIFAAAMQDYNRAIVVGSESTYGKGTVQNFTELDRMVPKKPADMTDLGSLKMTVQKFYRINGDATQLKGVTPEIIFPDYYNYMEFGEEDLDYPMPFTEITPLKWEAWTPTYDEEFIMEVSKKRIESDTLLEMIKENGIRLKDIRDNTQYSLNYETYTNLLEQREEEGKRFDRIGKDTLGLIIDVAAADRPAIEADTSKKARTDAWIMDLKKDVYLSEAFDILSDMNNYEVVGVRKDDE